MKTEVKELVIECKDKEKKLIESLMDDIKATTSAIDVKFDKGEIETEVEGLKVSVKI